MARYVLDTDVFVLYLMAQEGGAIQRLLREAEAGAHQVLMSVYNAAEVAVHLARRLQDAELDRVLRAAQALPIQHVSVTDALVYAAARLRAHHGYAEQLAFALATAIQEDAVLITRDAPGFVPEGVAVCPLVTGRERVPARQVFPSLA